MMSLSALGIGLGVVFGMFVLLLVAELYHLLCWKRKSVANPMENIIGHDSLLITEQSGGASALQTNSQILAANFHAELVAKLFPVGGNGQMDVMHLNHLLEPPRLLFTIKEETEEDLISEDGKSKGLLPGQMHFHGSNECNFSIPSESATPEETPFVTPPSSPSGSPPHLYPLRTFATPAPVGQGSPCPPENMLTLTPPCTPPLRSALSSPFERTSPLHPFQRAPYRSRMKGYLC